MVGGLVVGCLGTNADAEPYAELFYAQTCVFVSGKAGSSRGQSRIAAGQTEIDGPSVITRVKTITQLSSLV